MKAQDYKDIKTSNAGTVKVMANSEVWWQKKMTYNIDKFLNDGRTDLTRIDGPQEIYSTNIHKFRLTFGPNTPRGLIDRSSMKPENIIVYIGSKNIKTNSLAKYFKRLDKLFDNGKSFENDGGIFEWVINNEFVITMPENCVLDRYDYLIFVWYKLDQHRISKEQLVKNLDIKLEVLEVI